MAANRAARKRKVPEHFSALDPGLDRNVRLAMQLSLESASAGGASGSSSSASSRGSAAESGASSSFKQLDSLAQGLRSSPRSPHSESGNVNSSSSIRSNGGLSSSGHSTSRIDMSSEASGMPTTHAQRSSSPASSAVLNGHNLRSSSPGLTNTNSGGSGMSSSSISTGHSSSKGARTLRVTTGRSNASNSTTSSAATAAGGSVDDDVAEEGTQVVPSGMYRGVVYANGRWLAQVRYRGQNRVLGSFDSSVEAASAYDEMAARLLGGVSYGGFDDSSGSSGDGAQGQRSTNFDAFDGPVSRFGYGLVQSQGYCMDTMVNLTTLVAPKQQYLPLGDTRKAAPVALNTQDTTEEKEGDEEKEKEGETHSSLNNEGHGNKAPISDHAEATKQRASYTTQPKFWLEAAIDEHR